MDFEENVKLDPQGVGDLETAKLSLKWTLEKLKELKEELSVLKEEKAKRETQIRELILRAEQSEELVKKWQSTVKPGKKM